MGNNIFQGPFNITSGAINAALAGKDLSGLASLNIATAGYYGWSGLTVLRSPSSGVLALRNFAETISTEMVAEASDTLALRRSTNSQAFRLYNTFTDGSNYERGEVSWSGNVFQIASGSAGTGLSRKLRINGGGSIIDVDPIAGLTSVFRDGTSSPTQFAVLGNGIVSTAILHTRLAPTINQASGTYCVLDINPTETATGAGPHYLIRGRVGGGGDVFNVDRTGAVAGRSLTLSTGDFALGSGNFFLGTSLMVLGERADPGAPSANFGYLYCRDNGSGKTQIVARFPTGAIQVIATEP